MGIIVFIPWDCCEDSVGMLQGAWHRAQERVVIHQVFFYFPYQVERNGVGEAGNRV